MNLKHGSSSAIAVTACVPQWSRPRLGVVVSLLYEKEHGGFSKSSRTLVSHVIDLSFLCKTRVVAGAIEGVWWLDGMQENTQSLDDLDGAGR